MTLRIFLTSDLHLGMKFAGYPEVQMELSEARFGTLEALVASANENRSTLFVIAGDLFDRVSISKRDILRASQILKNFQGRLVAVLPGNHDFVTRGQTDLWTHFKENAGDHVLVLEEKRPYPLLHYDVEAVLYPAPCGSKHSGENGIAWIREAPKDRAVKHHIGIAHGSLEGFSPDFDEKYYPMTRAELLACELDLWLMGHTHLQYGSQSGQNERIFYPGTPEPDGFDCRHEGKAWVLDLAEDRSVKALSVSTGKYLFLHESVEVSDSTDLDALRKKFTASQYRNTLLKLRLSGRIPREEYPLLSDLHRSLQEELLYLSWNDSDVAEEITVEGISREFTEGSFPHALLTELAESGDSEALQVAYDLIQSSKTKR